MLGLRNFDPRGYLFISNDKSRPPRSLDIINKCHRGIFPVILFLVKNVKHGKIRISNAEFPRLNRSHLLSSEY